MDWTKNAKGIYLDDGQAVADFGKLANQDFLIARTGEKFTANVQAAYDACVPCIMFVGSEITRWIIDHGVEMDGWPKIENTPVGKEVQRYLYAGTARRAVHGIMIDASAVSDDEKGKLTATWITRWQKYVIDQIYRLHRLPVYLYMNKSPIKAHKDTDGEQAIIQMLREYGVSTVNFVSTINGYPSGELQPDLPYNGGRDWTWHFWLYSSSPMSFLYNGSAEALYDELGYTPVGGEAPPEPQPEEEPREYEQRIAALEAEIAALWGEIRAVKEALRPWIG